MHPSSASHTPVPATGYRRPVREPRCWRHVAAVLTLAAGLTVAPVPHVSDAKYPGQVHCYRATCHRVKTIEETERLIGIVRTEVASFYDDASVDRFNTGRFTSNGEIFDAASTQFVSSSHFPDGTELVLRNPANGRTAHVRVNDFGPFWHSRTLDVTRAVAEHLDFHKMGVTPLTVIVVAAPGPDDLGYVKARRPPRMGGYLGVLQSHELPQLAARLTAAARERHMADLRDEIVNAHKIPLPSRLRQGRHRDDAAPGTVTAAVLDDAGLPPLLLAAQAPQIDAGRPAATAEVVYPENQPEPAQGEIVLAGPALRLAEAPPYVDTPTGPRNVAVVAEPAHQTEVVLPGPDPVLALRAPSIDGLQATGARLPVAAVQPDRPSPGIVAAIASGMRGLQRAVGGVDPSPAALIAAMLLLAVLTGLMQRARPARGVTPRRAEPEPAPAAQASVNDLAADAAPPAPQARIGAEMTVRGRMRASGLVVVEGAVEGETTAGTLVIEAGGRVDGTVTATTVVVRGVVAGSIRAREIRLEAGAAVTGELVYFNLAVAPTALLDAECRWQPPPRETAEASDEPPATAIAQAA